MGRGFNPADDIHLVYIRGVRGPWPQLIPSPLGGAPFVEEHLRPHVLAKHRLRIGDRSLSFAELAKLYPPPEVRI
jgi:hypothetical protein